MSSVGKFAAAGFVSSKKRRSIYSPDAGSRPPLGGGAYLSSVESERRTFTRFRVAIIEVISPHEIDHFDFVNE